MPSSPVLTVVEIQGEKCSLKNLNTLPQHDIQHLSFDAFIMFCPHVLHKLLKWDMCLRTAAVILSSEGVDDMMWVEVVGGR